MKKGLLLTLIPLLMHAQPLLGEADNLTYEKNRITYEGNVRLTRGNALLTARKVVIHLDENRKARLAEAEGHVRYVEGNRRGFADKMVYDLKEEIITLKGNARVEEGPNFVEGEEIIYYRKEDRAVAIGRKSRVRTFYVEEKNEKGKPDGRP
ncbi:MAG: lipopolysaccharide transport periplasmic protein LptA [Aquificaceae bacterium]|nr:lipopolysaccharide transport periplasmic protein LptA [Aquificaceae bacterium]